MATYTTNKPAVRDSFDDDDISDDVDDEVFIRDGKNGFKMDEERGVKRPLMAPRRKTKSTSGNQFHPEICKQPQCRAFCVPCCYGLLAFVALFGLVAIVVVIVNLFPFPLDRIRIWSENIVQREKLVLPCIDLKTRDVWVKTFPKLTSEAALKLNDVNKDGIQDIIVGYGTGADELGLGEEVCASYMPGTMPCQGGVMALDGRTGAVLWQHWTHRSVLFVDCSTDITGDKTNDCVISGKGGVLSALNGRDGSVIWQLKKPPNKQDIDVYAVQFINDVDFDLVPDILAAHSSIQTGDGQGHVVILSGRTSSVVAQVATPNHESVFSAPQLLVRPDGTNVLLLATGTIDSPGGLYAVPLHHLATGNISQSLQLLKSGVNEAPVLVDLNKDGTEDIVAISEDRVTAIDGISLEPLWNATSTSVFGKLRLLNSPTPTHFNDDDIPDLLFTHVVGTSYPEYYFSQTSVVDGHSGVPLLESPIISSGFVNIPGLSLSMSGDGNDFFLYWVAVCVGHENTQQHFSFLNSTPVRQRARADLCRLRFNSSLDLRLFALSQHTAPPGILLFSSEKRWGSTMNVSWSGVSPGTMSDKKVWQQQEQQPPLKSFHHTGSSVALPHFAHNTHHRQQFGNKELPINLEEFERMAQRPAQSAYDDWHPQEPAYGSNLAFQSRRYPNLGLYGGVLGEVPPEPENGGVEGEEGGPVFGPSTLGRDERADIDRPRRSTISTRFLPHVGSSGVLAGSMGGSSVDIVVTNHWLPAADDVFVRLPRDEQCIQERLARLSSDKFTDMEALRVRVEEECLVSAVVPSVEPTQGQQLTVCRLSLQCSCDAVVPPAEQCARVLPYTQQSWPQRGPDVYFKPRTITQPILA